jgi:hypothetical protein
MKTEIRVIDKGDDFNALWCAIEICKCLKIEFIHVEFINITIAVKPDSNIIDLLEILLLKRQLEKVNPKK